MGLASRDPFLGLTLDGKYEIVSTGLEGRREPHAVDRVIGHDPLRQFLVAAPDMPEKSICVVSVI